MAVVSALKAVGWLVTPVSWPRARDRFARVCQPGRMSPGRPAAGRTRWRRPSGWVTVPSFSAWVSSGKRTSALAAVAVAKVEKATTKLAASSACVQALVSPKSRRGSTPTRITPSSSPSVSAWRISSTPRPWTARAARPGPASGAGVGEAPRLAEAAGVGRLGDLQQARALGPGDVQRVGEAEQLVGGRGADPLAPDDDDLARLAQRLGDRGGDVVDAAADRSGERADEVGGLAGGVAGERLSDA